MGWTAPATYTNPQLMSATDMNLIRDNLNYLKNGRVLSSSPITGTPTTTSATFVVLTGATVTMTTVGGNVRIDFVGSAENTGLNANVFTIEIDAVNQGDATFGLVTTTVQQANALQNASCSWITTTPPSAGSHTYAVYWRTVAGTATCRVGRIWAMEVG